MTPRIIHIALAACCVVSFCSTASAADTSNWQVDPGKSTLGFSGVQTGTKFEGKFMHYNAAISFDPDHPEASHIAVTVDLASAQTGDTQRDTALPGTDWFDVAQFPQAKFETTAIHRKSANAYEADGLLTLRSVAKPVSLLFTLDIAGATAHAKGHADLVRSAFGIGQGPWATGQWVALDIGIDIDITAIRAN